MVCGVEAQVVVKMQRGIFAPDPTMEIVRDRVDEYMDPGRFIVPDQASEEITWLLADLRSG